MGNITKYRLNEMHESVREQYRKAYCPQLLSASGVIFAILYTYEMAISLAEEIERHTSYNVAIVEVGDKYTVWVKSKPFYEKGGNTPKRCCYEIGGL